MAAPRPSCLIGCPIRCACLQAGRQPFGGVCLVHVDSHPDLSLPPALPATTVLADPPALYQALE